MKCFLFGIAGTFLVLFIAVVFASAYSDYEDRAVTSGMLEEVEALKREVEINMISGREVTLNKSASNYSSHIKLIKVLSNGTIIVKGGNAGQVFVLIPSFFNTGIIWKCIGGNDRAMPPSCRNI